jgi:hypothetical protein
MKWVRSKPQLDSELISADLKNAHPQLEAFTSGLAHAFATAVCQVD